MHTTDTSGGSLREHLIDTGVTLVDTEGTAALSLREIARRAGVSHGAPRRHFPTHLQLLSAIARRGFTDLGEQTTRALADAGQGPRAQVAALARTYLGFAARHRGMYELMFRHDLLESGELGLRETSLRLFAVLTDRVAAARPDAEPALVAGALWANLHGLAQLWGWGSLQLAAAVEGIEPLLASVLDAHLGPEPR
ncbi:MULTISPECIES: TetR/AcrR family transcriptional regulator [unclassified Streptomyces]|uniref:TetR/AcrR family transcriptional regulator n=1 Tax=unclassified Streptomyces TaxID=2593676 RepID=UPI00278C1938|nr:MULTISPECIES: TetR/AcrR family transcriptional regulator [unclassified Streptomyces]